MLFVRTAVVTLLSLLKLMAYPPTNVLGKQGNGEVVSSSVPWSRSCLSQKFFITPQLANGMTQNLAEPPSR